MRPFTRDETLVKAEATEAPTAAPTANVTPKDPGYGAQGGKGSDLVHFFNEDGLGAIVNSSRGIIAAYKQEAYAEFGELNYADASRKAVEVMIEDISGAFKNR